MNKNYIKELQSGKTVSFRPRGNSMTPKIKSGELCTISPITDFTTIKKGDILFCKVKGNLYVHLVSAVDETQQRFQISNNHGHVNGWVSTGAVYGKLVSVMP